MKNTRLLCGLVVTLLAAAAIVVYAGERRDPDPGSQVGRYQLVQGKAQLLKLDTATGKVWCLSISSQIKLSQIKFMTEAAREQGITMRWIELDAFMDKLNKSGGKRPHAEEK